jgi:hypothetical protein
MSPDSRSTVSSAKTIAYSADDFNFETLEQENGKAVVIKFRLEDPYYNAGDVLVVMKNDDILFHGMIGQLADGWAIATDRRASLLLAKTE